MSKEKKEVLDSFLKAKLKIPNTWDKNDFKINRYSYNDVLDVSYDLTNIDLDFKNRRVKLGLFQSHVADATGINISLISRYERGMINIGLVNAMKIDCYLREFEN